MSSLNQYIDLYKENRDTICSLSVEAMNALRDKALCALTDKKLPKKGDENYLLPVGKQPVESTIEVNSDGEDN